MMNKYGIRLWRRRRYLDRLLVLSVPYSFLSKIQPYSRILDPANLRTCARVRHVWRRCNGFINFATWSCEPNRSTDKPRGPVRFGRGVKTEILVSLTSSTQPSPPISEFTRRKRFSFYFFYFFMLIFLCCIWYYFRTPIPASSFSSFSASFSSSFSCFR